jgi:flagellar biosynthetic protein FliR
MYFDFLQFPIWFQENLDLIWTFMLLFTRYAAFMLLVPGIGAGMKGIPVRKAGILAMTYASVISGQHALLPGNLVEMFLQIVSEALLGGTIGLIPLMAISGVQMGGMLSSVTMGLGASQMIDPTSGGNSTSVARLLGDLLVILFLLVGGHHVLIYAVSGLGGTIVPGTFMIGETSTRLLLERSGDIFRVGVLISAPVIVALLLTQFMLGLMTKAVPSVNIFIVSFPLTIGIGLVLTSLSIPEIFTFFQKEFTGVENAILILVRDAQLI